MKINFKANGIITRANWSLWRRCARLIRSKLFPWNPNWTN